MNDNIDSELERRFVAPRDDYDSHPRTTTGFLREFVMLVRAILFQHLIAMNGVKDALSHKEWRPRSMRS